jgi:hypothetical protein
MRNERAAVSVLLLVALLVLPGCGDKSTSQVSGLVKFDGQAIPEGAISFYPVDGKTRTAGGQIKDGNYSVKVPVATMIVRISMPKVVGKKKLYNAPNSPERPLTAEALPARYNSQSELKLDVTPGEMHKDWDLTSK